LSKDEKGPLEEEIAESQEEEEETPVDDEPLSTELEQESSEPSGGHICPFCHIVQDSWIYRKSKKGWAECECGKFIRRGLIPEEFIVEQPDDLETKPRKDPESSEEDEEDYDGDEDGDEGEEESLFRERTPAHKILKTVFEDYGVKKVAARRIVGRCERMGGEMVPAELHGMLLDMNSGLKPREVKYCVDEYVDALNSEDTRMADIDQGRRSPSYSRRRYVDSESSQPSSSRRKPRGRSEWGGTPWDPRGNETENMTKDEVLQFIEKRDIERDRRLAADKKDEEILNLREVSARLEQKLEDFVDNPPSAHDEDALTKADLEEAKSSEYMKALELQLSTQQEERRREAEDRKEELRIMREEAKDSRDRFERQAKEDRDRYEKRTDDLQLRLESEQRRGQDAATAKTGDYSKDEMKLVAEGLSKLGSVVERRGSPMKQFAEVLPQLQQIFGQGSGQPPVRERMGPSSVAELVAEEQPSLVSG